MRLLRTYASRSEAELALALLQANRVDAVLAEPGGAVDGAAAQDLRLSVPADQHLQALALLTDEAESRTQVPAVARSAAAQRIAVLLIRGAALFFVVNALLSIAALSEHAWRGGAAPAPPAPSDPRRAGVQEDIARLAFHLAMGGLLLVGAGPLARIICGGRAKRHHGEEERE